ncbi:hypothetical protein OGAPHI_007205 [Ogataea philodendri]|uniref:Uncharacterized protein n=1 Tax=Ogataea philodendri TaxID=1378263 RepID=A0A9P8NUK4_9ASCO|nr:uncharacterized protein OGAPHI_007205 [Ogataea philodendri]KAH3660000.1 hypothetical protein OGAPHI_007205 [Ogataea philodendri]
MLEWICELNLNFSGFSVLSDFFTDSELALCAFPFLILGLGGRIQFLEVVNTISSDPLFAAVDVPLLICTDFTELDVPEGLGLIAMGCNGIRVLPDPFASSVPEDFSIF